MLFESFETYPVILVICTTFFFKNNSTKDRWDYIALFFRLIPFKRLRMHDVSCWQASVRLLTVGPFCWIGKERWCGTRSQDETLQCAKSSRMFFNMLQCAKNFQKVLQDDAVVSNSNKLLQSSVKVLQKIYNIRRLPRQRSGEGGI